MVAQTVNYVYRYPAPSELLERDEGRRLALSTCDGTAASPYFFEGAVRRPRLVADLLLCLSTVVESRFDYAIQAAAALRDPVVTSGERLRFEAFSSCCSAYVRVDLCPQALDGDVLGRGTTNVDFNTDMRAALARVRDHEPMRLSVGEGEVKLTRPSGSVVEKKVKMPLRWLRGFVEATTCQARMAPRFEVSGIEARRFITSLPSRSRRVQLAYVLSTGAGLRLGAVERPDAVLVGEVERLALLKPLLPHARRMRVFQDPETLASAWELEVGDAYFVFTITASGMRGFSGEGQALASLARGENEAVLAGVRAQLRWQSQIDAGVMAQDMDVTRREVLDALCRLGTRGLVGYDLSTGDFFHRELPFDMSLVEKHQPRLANARKLLEEARIEILERGESVRALVRGGGDTYNVRISGEETACTCHWYAKHQGRRGPCKHVLALRLWLDEHADA